MLKATELKKLKDLGIDTKKLIDAIKDEAESDFEIPAINNMTEDQLAERDENTVSAAKPAILAEGKNTGIEIANKVIAKKFNLTDVDLKKPDSIVAALEKSVAKGDSGLQEQITLLQSDKVTLEQQIETEKSTARSLSQDSDLLTSFPTNRTGLSDKEFLTLTKMSLQFEDVDGIKVVKRDGVILRDPKTQKPIAAKEAIDGLFTEKKWVSANEQVGRGGNDNTGGSGGKTKKYSQALEDFKKQSPDGNEMSTEFEAFIKPYASEPTFDWNN
jgi:hypothetical protein